jgi:hypothetical protein
MKKTTSIILFIGILSHSILSQKIENITINEWLCCNVDAALKTISKKHRVAFAYDSNTLSQIDYNAHHRNRPLLNILDKICENNKLHYYMTKDSVIHLISKKEKIPDETIRLSSNPKKLAEKKSYSGPPARFNFTLSGRIVQTESGEPLPFVNVFVAGTSQGSISNVEGYFTLLDVPSDTATIVFRYLGYQNQRLFLTPQSKLEDWTIQMKTESVNLDDITVTAEKQDILQVSGQQTGMIKMSPKKLSSLPNLGEKDIFRSFQLMPGISAANENSSGLYVRGGTPDQSLVLYDGFTVYNVEHLFGFFSTFNSNTIKDVQLFKGGFDAKYGGRLSSVVDITGKEGNKNTFAGNIDLSLMSLNGFLEFPLGSKTSAVIAARRSWKSPLYTKLFDQFTEDNNNTGQRVGRMGSNTQTTQSYFYDINTKITHRPTDKSSIALSFYNGQDNLDNSLQPQLPARFANSSTTIDIKTEDLSNWGNTGTSLKYSHQLSDRLYLNSLVSYSNYFSLRKRSTGGNFSKNGTSTTNVSRGINEDNNLKDYTAKIDLEYLLSTQHQLGFGLQATYNDIDYEYLQNDTILVVDRSTNGMTFSSYLMDKITLSNNNLIVTPGLRHSYFSETQKHYFEPRLNAMYRINPQLKLKGSAGQYYQFVKRVMREDITQGSRDFWVLSDNQQLPVSSSFQFVLGMAYETPDYLFDVEAYYKNLNNVTEYSLRIEPSRGSLDYSENFFTGTGNAKGIDFLLQKKQGRLTGWFGYTIGQTTTRIDEFGDYDFYASHDVTHELKAVGTYKVGNWDLGANWIYATGRPYTAPEGSYQLTLLDGSTADFINVSVKNGNRLPAYHRLDVSATLNFKFDPKVPGQLGFSLFNVYNRSNIWHNEYEIIDTEVIETPVYFLGITPNINFSIKF